MKGLNIVNPNEQILTSANITLNRLVKDYESYCLDKFLIHVGRTDSMFYSLLTNKSKFAERNAVETMTRYFRELIKDAGEVCPHDVLKAFKSTISLYFREAFAQHRSVYAAEMMKARDELQTRLLQTKLFDKAMSAQTRALKKKGKIANPVISVGNRSYHLNNYVRLVADYQARQKFWFNEISAAKRKGAIGFRIVNEKPQCRNCADIAGKEFFFDKDPGNIKFPPLHPSCRCVVLPLYRTNEDIGF